MILLSGWMSLTVTCLLASWQKVFGYLHGQIEGWQRRARAQGAGHSGHWFLVLVPRWERYRPGHLLGKAIYLPVCDVFSVDGGGVIRSIGFDVQQYRLVG